MTRTQADAVLEFAHIAAKTAMLGDNLPDAVESLTKFDFDHTFADSMSVAVDSNCVDGDSTHPYYKGSIGHETSEMPRAAASLAFIQHAANPVVRPNRTRATNVVAQIVNNLTLPPVLLDPLRTEFCMDVMLYCHWFASLLFYEVPSRTESVGTLPLPSRVPVVGAQHYLRATAYAHAMRLVYPIESLCVFPASPTVVFLDNQTMELEEVAALAGSWTIDQNHDLSEPPALVAALTHADAVGFKPEQEILTAAMVAKNGSAVNMPLAAVSATIGGGNVTLVPSGHSFRQVASAALLRGAGKTVVNGKAQPANAVVRSVLDACQIPDVFYCHAPIGGRNFLCGMLSAGGLGGSLSIARALEPVPFAVIDYAMRAAVAARLPWLRLHLPTVAENIEPLVAPSLSDQRIGDALRGTNRSALHAVMLSARALGIDVGSKGLEATVLATDL